MRDVVDIGDGVPDSSGKREENRWQRLSCNTLSCVACEICIFGCVRSLVTLATRAWRVTGKLGDFGKEKERVPGESLESIGKS